jgi:hypothetical protein
MSIGETLDKAGWLQGTLVKVEDHPSVYPKVIEAGNRIIIISQSCDIIKTPDESEPYVEVIVAEPIVRLDGNKTYNKNPRELHLVINSVAGDHNFKLLQHRKYTVERKNFLTIAPDEDAYLTSPDISLMTRWLSSRYQRPAFPNDFNEKILQVKKDNKNLGKAERKAAKKLSPDVSGIFLMIYPFRDLKQNESYSVSMIALVPGVKKHIDLKSDDIVQPIKSIVRVMETAGMEVEYRIKYENEVPYSLFRDDYKLWSFDDISLRESPPHKLSI